MKWQMILPKQASDVMSRWTDERLTAYLDGELPQEDAVRLADAVAQDAELAARLAGLHVDVDALQAAFGPMLQQAPADMSAGLKEKINTPKQQRAGSITIWGMALAASVALGVGFGAGRLTDRPPEPAKPGWVSVVASYQSLYAPQTIAGVSQTRESAARQVLQVAQAVGVDVTLDKIIVDGLTFKRGQILRFGTKPLAQFMYQSANGTPVAICAIAISDPDSGIVLKQVQGMNAAILKQGGFAYLVIGNISEAEVQHVAQQLSVQL